MVSSNSIYGNESAVAVGLYISSYNAKGMLGEFFGVGYEFYMSCTYIYISNA
jgi:hypothetical protein